MTGHLRAAIFPARQPCQFQMVDRPQTALGVRVAAAQAFDLIAKEFEAKRRLGIGRKDIENAASPAELAGEFDDLAIAVAVLDEPTGQRIGDAVSPCRRMRFWLARTRRSGTGWMRACTVVTNRRGGSA